MRTLDEIVAAVRTNEAHTEEELVYAVVAFDVMLAQMELERDPSRLQHWMAAATQCPRKYAGGANDPRNTEVADWYRAMHDAGAFKCPDSTCGAPLDPRADHRRCAPF